MNKYSVIAFLIIALPHYSCPAQGFGPEAMLTVRALDESGQPVKDARVAIYSDVYAKNKVVQSSSLEGLATGRVRTFAGSLFYGVSRERFYGTHGDYVFSRGAIKGDPKTWATKHWEPWNPTVDVVLKLKGPLLPMYAKRIQTISLPEPGKDIGYDFERGDWVGPHGTGKTTDLIFTGTGDVAKGSYRLKWTFSNPGDGIRVVPFEQGARSELKSPKEAPTDGYAPSLEINAEGSVCGADGPIGERPACFVFRVRTVLDEKGKVVTAHYGKIYPEQLNVVYYLNPEPNSRSLEYDPKRNLFGKPPSDGQINDY